MLEPVIHLPLHNKREPCAIIAAMDEATTTPQDLEKLPAVNWGALFMPAVWGPAHGQWITILFYPLWIFADSCLLNAVFYGGFTIVLAVTVVLGTAGLMIFFARTVGQKAYLRVAHKTTLEDYLRRERIWVVVSILIALLFIGLATWYNVVIRLPLGP